MAVTVVMNKGALAKIKLAQYTAMRKTAAKILAEKIDSQEIPMYEGTLQNTFTDVDERAVALGTVKITTEGPYAERLYYNPQYNFNHEFNVNAKGEWWEDWLTGSNKDRASKLFEYFYKESAGGLI